MEFILIIIKIKDTDNIIGVKEQIAMRLEDIEDIVRIDVREDGGDKLWQNAECLQKQS